MQTEFNLVLQKLSEAGSDSIISQVQKIFLAITKMSDDQLVATYQTIDIVGRNLGLADHRLSSLVSDIKKAIVTQMQYEVLRYDPTGVKASRFRSVTNAVFDHR